MCVKVLQKIWVAFSDQQCMCECRRIGCSSKHQIFNVGTCNVKYVVYISTACTDIDRSVITKWSAVFLFSVSYATQTFAPDGSVATSTGATPAAVTGYAGYGTTGVYCI